MMNIISALLVAASAVVADDTASQVTTDTIVVDAGLALVLRHSQPQDDDFFAHLRAVELGFDLQYMTPDALRQIIANQVWPQAEEYRRRFGPSLNIYVVQVGEQRVGQLCVDVPVVPEALTLVQVSILEEWRNQGLGTLLVSHVQRLAGEQPVLLRVPHGCRAHHLFARLGFLPYDDVLGDMADDEHQAMIWRASEFTPEDATRQYDHQEL